MSHSRPLPSHPHRHRRRSCRIQVSFIRARDLMRVLEAEITSLSPQWEEGGKEGAKKLGLQTHAELS